MSFTKRRLRDSALGRYINLVPRIINAASYYTPVLPKIGRWLISSREYTNFTYEITDRSTFYAAHLISSITATPLDEIMGYFDELQNDEELKQHVIATTMASSFRSVSDRRCDFGRRKVWYALTRITKPKIVMETGVDKGLGSVMLCAALKKNASEGSMGQYFGTDIYPRAGWLLGAPYNKFGKILYGDSVESIEKFGQPVDLFINDSDHSEEYEQREYQAILPKLSKGAIILGDNSHATDKLALFSAKHGRQFIYFGEAPKQHWYPGGGVGISFTR
jgi:predicted O-methyltransferase YrrM